jgi:hypothetical protein
MADSVFKDELVLAKSIYNTNEVRKELEALAQVIQNLIIIEPGTYPNDPSMGVGIEGYQFEFLDAKTISDLRDKIDSQIKRFIPTDITIDFNVETIKNELGKNVLLFTFLVSGNPNYQRVSQINMLFGKNKDNGKVMSKIII